MFFLVLGSCRNCICLQKDHKHCPKCGSSPDIPASTIAKVSSDTSKELKNKKSEEQRQFGNFPSKKAKRIGKQMDDSVTISIGMDAFSKGVMKYLRGKYW